jgi:excinuclease UvrABC nuclease subunit
MEPANSSSTKKKYEPWEELPDKNLERVKVLTEATHKAIDNIDTNLATDIIKVPGQNWACVSFVSPDGNQKNKQLGMKIRGIFDQHSEAVEHVKRLIRLDPVFDIYICEMYNWCLIPPDPEKIADQTYQNEELNKIVSEYRKNQIYAKEHFEERKREMMEQAAEESRAAALKKLESANNTIVEEEEPEVTPTDLMESMVNCNIDK